MKTQVFKNKAEFLAREDKDINGVSENFAKGHPNYEDDNKTNKACWNCSYCFGCSRCSNCSDCSNCSNCHDCSYCFGCSRCSNCSDCSDCSDCSRCSNCHDCSDCSRCSEKKGAFDIPTVIDLNKKVFEATSQDCALEMNDWHTCGTTHCWAGWIVHLAGEDGYALEKETSTLFAAMQIYKKSTGESISPCNFFISNEEAMKKIADLAK